MIIEFNKKIIDHMNLDFLKSILRTRYEISFKVNNDNISTIDIYDYTFANVVLKIPNIFNIIKTQIINRKIDIHEESIVNKWTKIRTYLAFIGTFALIVFWTIFFVNHKDLAVQNYIAALITILLFSLGFYIFIKKNSNINFVRINSLNYIDQEMNFVISRRQRGDMLFDEVVKNLSNQMAARSL